MIDRNKLANKLRKKPKGAPPKPEHARLPAGSRKLALWDGERWHCTLIVPNGDGASVTLTYVAPTERSAMEGTDRRYRQFLKSEKAGLAKPDGGTAK